MDDILRISLITLLLTFTLAAYFLVIGVLFNDRVTKTRNAIRQMPARAFWLGLVNLLFFGVIAFVLLSVAENAGAFVKGILTIPALVILAIITGLLSSGLTGMVGQLGEKLFPDLSVWKQIFWAAVVLCVACALPFVGWFLLLPYVCFVGIGATILGFFQRNA